MDKKKLAIAGGTGLLVLLFLKHKSAAAAQAQAAQNSASPVALYSLPVSGGVSSQDSAAAGSDPLGQLPSAASSTMSSPDMGGLLSSLLGQQATQNQAQILANQNTADSQALAGIDLGPQGGTATLTHSATGTTLNLQPVAPIVHVPAPNDIIVRSTPAPAPAPANVLYYVNGHPRYGTAAQAAAYGGHSQGAYE